MDNGMNRRTKFRGIPSWMVAGVDVTLVSLSFYLSFTLRFLGQVPEFNIEPFAIMVPWVALLTLILFSALGLYSRRLGGFMPILRSIVTGVIGVTLCSVVIAFWVRAFTFPRAVFLIVALLQLIFLVGWRLILWRLELWVHGQRKLLILGNLADVEQALDKLLQLPRGMFEIVKVLEPDKAQELPRWLEKVDTVMLTGSLDMDLKSLVIRESFDRGIEAFVVPDLYEILLTRAGSTQVYDTPVLEIRDMRLTVLQMVTKRALDLLVALAVALTTLPVTLAVGLAIRFTSPGPVIYIQERVGYLGRPFKLYKFRTMIHNAENDSGPVFATENDDRVTPVGRFLRVTRLDELPQLFNVLRGDLSLVGPRPERPYFVELFTDNIPEYSLRHLVKPGVTGLAQVAGYYSTETRDKLRFDLHYISDYSPLLDLKILLLTIPTVLNTEASRGLQAERLAEKGKARQKILHDKQKA